MNKFQTEIAKCMYEEPGAHVYFNWETIHEKDKNYYLKKATLILAKFREVVDGAALTPERIEEIQNEPAAISSTDVWEIIKAYQNKTAKAQRQAIKDAIGGD